VCLWRLAGMLAEEPFDWWVVYVSCSSAMVCAVQ
jgi:hypothetical protein